MMTSISNIRESDMFARVRTNTQSSLCLLRNSTRRHASSWTGSSDTTTTTGRSFARGRRENGLSRESSKNSRTDLALLSKQTKSAGHEHCRVLRNSQRWLPAVGSTLTTWRSSREAMAWVAVCEHGVRSSEARWFVRTVDNVPAAVGAKSDYMLQITSHLVVDGDTASARTPPGQVAGVR